jgi:cellulose synthase/poly-beta-1,6-N-acetylglucosamine synthase-like glycosyltransferase
LESGPDDLQLIIAYNTPRPLSIESDLARIQALEPRVTVLRVADSQSKAANVNAGLEIATGEIIAVFDADHHPSRGSYERAWRWLANGADVVQGRCAVRPSPDASRLSRLLELVVMAEIEQMYTVGHPGRARVQGFGLFGGSNGFWRASALKGTGLDPSAMTEDIDASIRLVRAGGRIVVDPGIMSTELAAPSIDALCHQRLRWAQGWLQVARRHLFPVIADRRLTPHQRIGAAWSFGAGSVLPWVGALPLPITLYDWIFGVRSAWAPIVGPLYAVGTISILVYAGVAYLHASPIARRPTVFATFLVANFLFYAHLRVALVRLGHLHEFVGRTEWRVTPRTADEDQRSAPGAEPVPNRRRWLVSPLPQPASVLAGAHPFAEASGQRRSAPSQHSPVATKEAQSCSP